MEIVIFEDAAVGRLRPLVDLKPVYGLHAGCRSLLQKFRFYLGPHARLTCHLRRYLEPFYRDHLCVFRPSGDPGRDILLVNGRLLCDARAASLMLGEPPSPGQSLVQDGEMVFARVTESSLAPRGEFLPDLIDTGSIMAETKTVAVEGFSMIANLWDMVTLQPVELQKDARTLELGKISGTVSPEAVLVNPANICIGEGAVVKPGAVLDAEDGFVCVSPGALVEPQAVLSGNVFLGVSARAKTGARIYSNVAIGNFSKAGGEIEDSVLESFSNKQHDGFLGHSYISSWCNLGAGTNTSDLRNNYGKVSLVIDGERVCTGEQFLGLLMGEHSKCSINSMFNTGTVAGTSANIFGSGFPPKKIPSFSWGGAGDGFVPYDVEKAVETARTVMARRNVRMNTAYESMFRYVAALERAAKTSL